MEEVVLLRNKHSFCYIDRLWNNKLRAVSAKTDRRQLSRVTNAALE